MYRGARREAVFNDDKDRVLFLDEKTSSNLPLLGRVNNLNLPSPGVVEKLGFLVQWMEQRACGPGEPYFIPRGAVHGFVPHCPLTS
jgi:hypothetical protein